MRHEPGPNRNFRINNRILEKYGPTMGCKGLCSDASAAIGKAHRQGLVKTRLVEVQYLWIQHEVKEGKLTVKKVGTNNNPVDLLTKVMNGEKLMKYMAEMGFDIDNTRTSPTPTL